MNAASSSPAISVPSQRARWRIAVLIAVLVGFFLMHGAASGDACSGSVSPVSGAATQNVASAAPNGVSAVSAPMSAASAPGADSCGCQGAMGAVCAPLRLQDLAAVVAIVLAGSAAVLGGGPSLSGMFAAVMTGARRRPLAAVPVRVLVCVSRT